MKKFIFILSALFVCYAASAGSLKTETIEDQGVTRSYYVYLPTDLPADAPLVFILHGYGGSANAYVNNSSLTFKQLAEEYKVALCYPQATTDPRPNTGWNVYYPWQIDKMKIDDCEFICNLAKHLHTKYNLSAKNTFLTGMSNGGEMCYLMAYRKASEFGAIASMAGLTLTEMAKRHDYTTPVAMRASVSRLRSGVPMVMTSSLWFFALLRERFEDQSNGKSGIVFFLPPQP